MAATIEEIDRMLARARRRLLDERADEGHWVGCLATSALSTATASTALALNDARAHARLIRGGLDWLADHANPDGGWGDTVRSKSNINTTALCWASLAMAPQGQRFSSAIAGAQAWLARRAGSLQPRRLVEAILAFYGADRTFSTPILTLLTLTGRLGPPRDAWAMVPALPFELAAFPHRWYKHLRLPVVSYALPALIAVGQVRHHNRPPRCPATRLLRDLVRGRTLAVLDHIQPPNGGFLEAIPLTSFVAACLAGMDRRDHPVARRCVAYLTGLVRDDGGWPIDANLATWVTTLSVNALAAGGEVGAFLDPGARRHVLGWLLAQQFRQVHVFTNADPGGWSWTDLPGAVPDADDTPAALIALDNLAPSDAAAGAAAAAGAGWLLDLQNRDGGMPTFCRGWGKLPFDRSAADLTAHALAAWVRWRDRLPSPLAGRLDRAIPRALAYLGRAQRPDGAWVPLWFGNEHADNDENPTYGTARVLTALAETRLGEPAMLAAAARWLLHAQRDDGAWGGVPGGPPSIEETALAVDALSSLLWSAAGAAEAPPPDAARAAVRRGVRWLIDRTEGGGSFTASPIGFYFAKLWYFERLYPIAFTVGAAAKARRALAGPR